MNQLRIYKLPLVTLIISAIAALITCSPNLSQLLEYQRSAVLAGEYWQIITGHFTHWSFDHFFWDALVILCCGCLFELNVFSEKQRNSSTLLAITIIISTLWIGLGLLFFEVDLVAYRGLSGISVALYMLVALDIAALSKSKFSCGHFAVAVLLGKIAFEAVTGVALFVDQDTSGFTTIYSAHLLGALAAITVHTGYRSISLLLLPDHADCFENTGRSF